MLNITNLQKTFSKGTVNERKVIKGLDLHLAPGEFVTVTGANGSGKSTLFALLSGAILPDGGKIFLAEEDITFWPEHKRAKKIGRVFQNPAQGTAPGLTIEENMALAAMRGPGRGWYMGISKKEKEFFREKLQALGMGLEDRMEMPVGLLSGGQRQALCLLMCTLVPPKLLLLDEHTAALDPAAAEKVLEMTNTLVRKERLTALMITHNMGAASMGDRTIEIAAGKAVEPPRP